MAATGSPHRRRQGEPVANFEEDFDELRQAVGREAARDVALAGRPRPPPVTHDDVERARRADARRVALPGRLLAVMAQNRARLPDALFIERTVETGELLAALRAHHEALIDCFLPANARLAGAETAAAAGGGGVEVEARLALWVRAQHGEQLCRASLSLALDPSLRHGRTRAVVRGALGGLSAAAGAERLYWLAFNGTVHLYRLCQPLMTAELCSLAVE
ncbi:hypothetical protein T492DRAFT_896703, partial [Pavlovales sp. CCMP2436]